MIRNMINKCSTCVLLSALFLLAFTNVYASNDPKVHLLQAGSETARHPITTQSNHDVLQLCDLEVGQTYSIFINVPKGQTLDATLSLGDDKSKQGKMVEFVATKSCTEVAINAQKESNSYIVTVHSNKPVPAPNNKMAVITTNGAATPQQMVDALTDGTCFTVSNVSYTGDAVARGTFGNGATSLGFNDGIVLSSGNIALVAGPNNGGSLGASNTGVSDANLAALTTTSVFNAAVLEFDLTVGPTTTFLSFDYVFGSEEYCFYTNTTFNDVFGFFISGPNPAGGSYSNMNIAQIPGAGVPVTINNVNHTLNALYYKSNIPSSLIETGGGCAGHPTATGAATTDCQLDGLTNVLTASFSCTPGQTYHIKLAIGDAGDAVLDSDVFLKTNSLDCQTSCNLAVTCPPAQTLDDTGDCGASASLYPYIVSSCPVGVSYIVQLPDGGTYSGNGAAENYWPIGTSTITFTVSDITGNVQICTTSVTVNSAPIPACPADISLTTDGESGCGAYANVYFENNYCSNVCAVKYTLSGATNSTIWGYSLYQYCNIGVTTITRTITLKDGSIQTCSFNVTVQDLSPPTVDCGQGSYSLYADNGTCTASICGADVYTTDNCGVNNLTYSITGGTNASGSGTINGVTFNGGSIVVYTVTDNSGNVSTCSTIVEVFGGTYIYYQDIDGDGHGNPQEVFQGCPPPAGYVPLGDDCDDNNQTVFPYAPELCDGIDNDCDGSTDEGFAFVTYYADDDNDGFGNPNSPYVSCDPFAPAGYAPNNQDCNDGNANIKPTATEICDGLDNDCDGLIDEGNVCCSNPSTSTAIIQSDTSVLITYPLIATATNYQVRYRKVGVTTWTAATTSGNLPYKLITGLMPNTQYQYQIRTLCSGTWLPFSTTTWTFTTTSLTGCVVPIPVYAYHNGPTKLKVYWTNVTGAVSYNLQYRLQGTTTWTLITTTTPYYEITGLTAGATYQYRVRMRCPGSTVTYSAWSSVFAYTMPASVAMNEASGDDGIQMSVPSKLKLFPNPATNELNIEIIDMQATEMNLMNINGQILKVLPQEQITETLDISALNSGVYLISVKDINGNIKTEKFVKE